ncbi:DUF6485 family protein [Breznakiella homolactica]|uniref:Cytosolic protein n=1 Tax=Breznakiella homolactica TaxID=2798577 RepID=A0A7T7XRA6_9SPIR|nr:DUF6485 family protein [Breznakiella homolactica]QQO11054.1 DUF6485 family protein [Breznakiella homolactica]
MPDCKIGENKKHCNCTYPCTRKGLCCDCVAYHRRSGEIPACYFGPEGEKSYDRSVENYLKTKGR